MPSSGEPAVLRETSQVQIQNLHCARVVTRETRHVDRTTETPVIPPEEQVPENTGQASVQESQGSHRARHPTPLRKGLDVRKVVRTVLLAQDLDHLRHTLQDLVRREQHGDHLIAATVDPLGLRARARAGGRPRGAGPPPCRGLSNSPLTGVAARLACTQAPSDRRWLARGWFISGGVADPGG